MAHDEEVEDLDDLVSAPPEGSGVEPAPPSDAGEGPLATPAPTGAGEGFEPATVPTSEDTSKVAGEPAVEDPVASAGPSQVEE
jgi:hypothetical protein